MPASNAKAEMTTIQTAGLRFGGETACSRFGASMVTSSMPKRCIEPLCDGYGALQHSCCADILFISFPLGSCALSSYSSDVGRLVELAGL